VKQTNYLTINIDSICDFEVLLRSLEIKIWNERFISKLDRKNMNIYKVKVSNDW